MAWSAVVVGDVHLKIGPHMHDTLCGLMAVVDLVIREDVDAVIFTGDMYDKASTPFERMQMAEVLSQFHVPVFAVKGNHDAAHDLEVFNGYEECTFAEMPCRIECGPVDLMLIPWPERSYLAKWFAGDMLSQAGSQALADLIRGLEAERANRTRPLVIVGHLQVAGSRTSEAQPLIGRAIEITPDDLLDVPYAAVVLGHVHLPQQVGPNAYYVGSLAVCDFGEENEQKRIGVLTIDEDLAWDAGGAASWEWFPVPGRQWVTIEASIQNGAVYEQVAGHFAPQDGGPTLPDESTDANVRYRYHCDESERHLFDHTEIERRYEQANFLKIVPVVTSVERIRSVEVAKASTNEDRLFAWGEATGEIVTDSAVQKLHELEEGLGP